MLTSLGKNQTSGIMAMQMNRVGLHVRGLADRKFKDDVHPVSTYASDCLEQVSVPSVYRTWRQKARLNLEHMNIERASN